MCLKIPHYEGFLTPMAQIFSLPGFLYTAISQSFTHTLSWNIREKVATCFNDHGLEIHNSHRNWQLLLFSF